MSAESAVPPPPETMIAGRYQPVRELGRGGMAVVWSVRDTVTGKELALKRLHRGAETREGVLFEREYRTLASLRHPLIVEVYDYGVDEQGGFYTMELLQGSDLTNASPMPWPQACSCLRDTASILGVLHARNLVYRDLNPRNLWRTPDGRIKLLDFGAMAPFGVAPEVVGAAPLVAPEALAGQPLDQRTDLYSLGALGYWLMTSAHAYRAARLDDLPLAWQRTPARPSSLVGLLRRDDTPDFPPALERLLLRLLMMDPADRPSTTEDVIDALNGVAELESETQAIVTQGYLQRSAFVGRDTECQRFAELLERACDGQPQALLVDGVLGTGRSRLLEEFATTARIRGAVTVLVACSGHDSPYRVASAALAGLLQAAPKEATEAFLPHASVLGQLCPELHAWLGETPLEPALEDPGDERMRRQVALRTALEALSRARPLVLLFDDLGTADEESVALLTALTRLPVGHSIFVCGACTSTAREDGRSPLEVFASRAASLTLSPFSAAELHELLRSVFGPVRYLDRLAARAFALTRGNASHCMLLARHLVDVGGIRYADGAWSLPMELPDAGLPTSLRDGWRQKRSRLTPVAQRLLSTLSALDQGEFSVQQCCTAAQDPAEDVEAAIAELRARKFLVGSSARRVHLAPELRAAIYADLSESEQRQTHERIATVLEEQAAGNPDRRLRASLHWLRAGRLDRGEPLLLTAATEHTTDPSERLRELAPLYAEAVQRLREEGREDHALLLPLVALSTAGFYVDRRYAERFGEDTVVALEAALKLRLAARLRPWLGRKFSLIVALVAAGIGLRFKRNAPQLEHLVYCMLVSCSTLVGTFSICLDPGRARRYSAALEPLTALGPAHAATLIHRFNEAVVLSIEDHAAKSIHALQGIVEWLQAPDVIEGIDASTRQRYLAGAIYARGIKEAFYVDSRLWRTAEQLQAFGRMYAVQADHLRALHHLYRGERAEAEDYSRRVEMAAIQRGTAWQAETWGAAMINNAFWACDAVALKGAAQQLGQLACELPEIAYYENMSRASHLLLHGRATQALQVLEAIEVEPLSRLAWGHGQGLVAYAHNLLGDHARAKQICDEVYRRKTAEEQQVFGLMVVALVEGAKARAGLGELDAAAESLDDVIDEQGAQRGPLLEGYLHYSRAQVALMSEDLDACQTHLERARRAWQRTGIPSALEALEALAFAIEKASPRDSDVPGSAPAGDGHLATRMQIVLESGVGSPLERIEAALRVACTGTGAVSGLVVFPDEEVTHISTDGTDADPVVVSWARQELRRSQEQEVTELISVGQQPGEADSEDGRVKQREGREYMWIPLWDARSPLDSVVGALVLGFEGVSPNRPSGSAWMIISRHLVTSCVAVSESRSRGPET